MRNYIRNYVKDDGNKTVDIGVEVDLFKEGDYIVAYCNALELSSFGTNEVQARENFEEALNTFVEETSKRGTLEKVLLDLGWSLRKKPTARYTPPRSQLKTLHNNLHRFKERVLLPI